MASVSRRTGADKNGNPYGWIVRYKDSSGVHRQRTFPRKKEADAYRARVTNELTEGTHIAPKAGRTVEAIAKLLLEDVRDRCSRQEIRPGTLKNYEDAFRLWIIPYLGNRLAHDLDFNDVECWMADMRKTGRLAAPMISKQVTFLKTMYEFAARQGWVSKNPTILARRGKAKAAPIRTFDIEQVKTLLLVAEDRRKQVPERAHLQRRCTLALAAFCGMRYGEIYGLLVKNVDLEAGRLDVRTGLDRFGNLQPPKTAAGVRTIMIPSAIVRLLKEWSDRFTPDPGGLMFTTLEGKPISQSNFHNKAWKPLLKQAGLDNAGDEFHFHALRHFAASWMIENGWPLPDVARQLGHSDVALTLRVYAHAVAKRSLSREAVDALAGPLLASPPAPQALLVSH